MSAASDKRAAAAEEPEAIEGEVLDTEADESAPKTTRPSREPHATNRPERARAPQDRKESQASLAAQRAEAADDEGLLVAVYDEIEVKFDPANFDVEFQIIAESGRPATALRHVIGAEQIKKFYRYSAQDLEEMIQTLAKAAGLGNS